MLELEDAGVETPDPERTDQAWNPTIHLVIVDDHALFREATIGALRSDPQIRILGEGSSATDALRLATEFKPDLILLDVAMPGGGLNAARSIAATHPKIKIVMLTFSEAEDDVQAAIAAGVQGYVLKGVSGTGLRMVVRAIFSGEHFISVDVSRAATASRTPRIDNR
jgi:two-component system, NarL family, nitrate/nitrite response regulator NarL